MKQLLILTICLSALCNSNAQQYFGDQKEIDKILKNIATFSQYVMSSDYEGIASSYTDNGKIFPNNTDIIQGREMVRKYWVLPDGISTSYHKIIPSEIRITGDYAYDYGYYEGKTLRKDGGESSWRGKYVIVWQKVDGDWKIYLDIWNRIAD